MDPPTASPPESGVGSPLVPLIALAAALVKAILYLLNVVRLLVAFLTITIPTWVLTLTRGSVLIVCGRYVVSAIT